MIGETQDELIEWEIVGDEVQIRRCSDNKLIGTESVGDMVDYAIRHTDYSEQIKNG